MHSFKGLFSALRSGSTIDDQATKRSTTSSSSQACLGFAPTLVSEAWLDERANDLGGEWQVARLASLAQKHGKAERLLALSTLVPLQELRLETDAQELYIPNAVKVLTLAGVALGHLELSAALTFHEQTRLRNMCTAYAYGTRWESGNCIGASIALTMWTPFESYFHSQNNAK